VVGFEQTNLPLVRLNHSVSWIEKCERHDFSLLNSIGPAFVRFRCAFLRHPAKPRNPSISHSLAERAHSKNLNKEALSLVVNLHKRAPRYPELGAAYALAARHLGEHPTDVGTWEKYLHVLNANKDDPEYHRAVKQVLQLAADGQVVRDAALGRLLENTYRDYVSGDHPKPALRDPRLLCALGKQFARTKKLDIARQITNGLLKAQRKEPELAQLLSILCAGLSKTGSGQLAKHYRAELMERFPDTV
jgi:hypothetical protein